MASIARAPLPATCSVAVRVASAAQSPAAARSSSASTSRRIVGVPEDESHALLHEFFAHSTQAAFVHRHRWSDRDMVFWDNRSVMHLAAGCPEDMRRRLHRTTIEGDAPR